MIVENDAEFMYPVPRSFDPTLVGLGCDGDKVCSKCLQANKGLGDISWSCATFGGTPLDLLLGPFCQDAVTQTQQDNSNYGKNLTQENRDLATSMALDTIAADMKANPCNYLSSLTPEERIFKCGDINWPLVGIAVIGGMFFYKHII